MPATVIHSLDVDVMMISGRGEHVLVRVSRFLTHFFITLSLGFKGKAGMSLVVRNDLGRKIL